MLDRMTLLFVAENMMARAKAERIMRDHARLMGNREVATMHGDRAQAFSEAASVIPTLTDDDGGHTNC